MAQLVSLTRYPNAFMHVKGIKLNVHAAALIITTNCCGFYNICYTSIYRRCEDYNAVIGGKV